MNRKRIAIGGIRHETNTFSPVYTNEDDFQIARGPDLLADEPGQLEAELDLEICPTFVARARPSGWIRKNAYLRLKTELLDELQATLPVDGVYLDLHGAMAVQEIGDGESDLVPAVRDLVGWDLPISVSLDLHANIGPAVIKHADILTAFRTAPHRDATETRRRALTGLARALREGFQPVSVLVQLPLLLAGESAVTDREPARSLYARLPEIERLPGILDASILIGCAWTDSLYTSVSTIVVAKDDKALARQQASELAGQIWACRRDFGYGVETASVDGAIRRAMGALERPVFLSDSGDNVTAGGAGDIPLFAERLLALGAREAVVAGLADPQAVHACAEAGVGSAIDLSIGGKLDRVNGEPLSVRGRVQHLDPGTPPATATVRVDGVTIILAADRRAFADRASIAAAGVDPMAQKIVVVKLGYLFPDLYDHAPRAIMALSHGATDLRLDRLPYRHLARPIYPLDGDLAWEPQP